MTEQPRTPEGEMARQIGMTPGLWRRAGEAGIITGLDWGSALQMIPAGFDREAVIDGLRWWEQGMLEGAAETAKERPR